MIERTQKKVELHHFDGRKHTLQYDEVLNDQRSIIYKERRKILEGADLRENILTYIDELVSQELDRTCASEVTVEQWDFKGLWDTLNQYFPLVFHASSPKQLEGRTRDDLSKFLREAAVEEYLQKEKELTPDLSRDMERYFALHLITNKWMEHLDAMDYLREGIGLRGYAQQDPVLSYRKEGANYFDQLVNSWKRDLIADMFKVTIQAPEGQQAPPPPPTALVRPMKMVENISGEDGHDLVTEMSRGRGPASEPDDAARPTGSAASPAASPRITPRARVERADGVVEKVGRNDPCPCGSGKKYKKCCLAADTAGVGVR
jgi:preprotein translocase subunit SecA